MKLFSENQKPILLICSCVICLTMLVAPDSTSANERPMQPTPANRPPGTARSPLDDVPRPGSTPQIDAETRERLLENLSEYVDLPEPELEKSDREGQVGGDDIQIIAGDNLQFASVAVSEGGDIFVACQVIDPVTDHEIQVFRSSDGGTAWDLWGRYRDPDPGVSYIDPHIVVAEGSDNRCFIAACKYIDSPSGREIVVAWADLTDVTATFTEVVVMDDAARFWKPRLASDAASFNSYFLYVVAYGYDSSGTDIWFARSTNQGDSWESKYRIASQETTISITEIQMFVMATVGRSTWPGIMKSTTTATTQPCATGMPSITPPVVSMPGPISST